MNGYLLAGPGVENAYGAASGNSLDYAYAERGLMALTLELGDEFYQECNAFDSEIYPSNLDVLLYSAKISGNPFEMSMGPDIKILSLGSNKIPQDSSFCVFAELLQAEKVDPFGNVTATLYIDSVQIENFVLSKSIQKFNFSLEATDLDIGQHMLHLEGTDEYGYIGPKSSIFFEVCDITKDETCKENTAPCPPINPNCAEVTVTITTDDYPQETSFRIFDSYTEPMSGSGYTGQRSTYTTNGCLSYGMYEFIIKDSKGDGMCCSYGNGSYELKVNGSVRKTGGQFTDSESTIFSTSPVPASTSAPNSGNCMNVVVIIKTDIYPEETSFKVVNQNGIEFMSGDSYTTKLYEYPASSCLPNSNIYQFTIYDTAGDGLCCTYGAGGYNLFVNGIVIKSGGVFTNSETITFPSNTPVPAPTNPPSPPPTTPLVPTPNVSVQVMIKTDYYPEETTFKIINQNNIEFMSGGGYVDALTEYSTTESLPNSNIYQFTIYDTAGDGICCLYGAGRYELTVDGSLIKSGDVFTISETTTFPTNAPVPVPISPPVPGPSIAVYVIIKTDNYPEETSFKVTNQDGIEFMSGGGYTAQLTEYTTTVSLPGSTVYQFTIYDTAGDGLCCSYGAGGYNLFVNGVVIKSGGVFTNSETTTFPMSSFGTFELHENYQKPKFEEPKYEKSKVDNSNVFVKGNTRKIVKEDVNDKGEH